MGSCRQPGSLQRQPRFAHAPRPHDGVQPLRRISQPGRKPGQLLGTPHHILLTWRQIKRPFCRRTLNLFRQSGRFWQRRYAQLFLQHLAKRVVGRQGRIPFTQVSQGLHELLLGRFTPRLDGQLLPGKVCCLLVLAAPLVKLGQLIQRFQRRRLELLPVAQQPFLKKRAVFQKKTIEKRACVVGYGRCRQGHAVGARPAAPASVLDTAC